jgi:phosphoglycerol transferase MdoB-like AlkP superfamily enzyme
LRLLALPAGLRFALLAAGLNFVVFAVLRLAFAAAFLPLAAGAPPDELLQALYIGLKFDLRLALLLSAPLALLGWIPALHPALHRGARVFWLAYFAAAQLAVLFLYAVDFGHFGYARTRLNASLLEHLTPAEVALRMAWQTYPVVWGLVGLAVAGTIYLLLLRRITRRAPAPTPRWPRAAGAALVLMLGCIGIWGKASWYPLRWSDAYFSTNDFVSAMGLNPVLFLTDTLSGRGEGYRLAKVREHYDFVADLLEVPQRDAESLSFARFSTPAKKEGAPVNLVVIHLESLAGFKVGALGNTAGATPHFDALAAEGLLFTNFFVPAVPTARSVFTMITGVPDYRGGRSASRDPLMARQHTLVNALTGHERFYFLGGSASWGNIRSLLAQSIDGLQVFEEGDFAAERADVWGITDHDLLEHAHAKLKAAKRPFFAFLQTSGNHRPFTIPDNNRHGFELATRDSSQLRAEGFDSLAAYNGLRFMDHAIGHFFKLARSEPYFRNTLFVLYGDHGNPSASDIPFERLGLTGYHVPMLVYAPGYVASGKRDMAASLVDVLPTALTLMGVPHLNQALGRDLLAPRPPERHFALLPDGVLNDELLLRVSPAGVKLFRYRSDTPTSELRDSLPAAAQELQRVREALYETARYMLYHNKPREHAPPVAGR